MKKNTIYLIITLILICYMRIANAFPQANSQEYNDLKDINSSFVVDYLDAYNQLHNDKLSTLSESFLATYKNTFLYAQTAKDLIDFYYSKNNYESITALYPLIDKKYISATTRCQYDIASLKIDDSIISSNTDINGKIPDACDDLITLKYKKSKLSQEEQKIILYKLIMAGDIDSFNKISKVFGFGVLAPSSITSQAMEQLRSPFAIVYKTNNIGKTDPESVMYLINKPSNKLSFSATVDRQFINNSLALSLALHQDFDEAIELFKNGDKKYFTDEMYEWQMRSYLAKQDWENIINNYKQLPSNLKNSNLWLYWTGIAYQKQNQPEEAMAYFKKQKDSGSYYYILGRDALNEKISTSKISPNSSFVLPEDIEKAIDVYLISQRYNDKLLEQITRQYILDTTSSISQEDLTNISQIIEHSGWYDLGIALATNITPTNIPLNYPMPYLTSYKTYAKKYQIETSYSLAISRQESRFKANVIAFDGGVGLMQLMPGTAAYISSNGSMQNCYKDSYDCNIQMGTWYLSHLSQKFGGNIIYSTAAYNGGPNRARRWQLSFNDLDNRIQIELIPIRITRGYVAKILTNKFMYDMQLNSVKYKTLTEYVMSIANTESKYIDDGEDTDAGKI